MGRDDRVVVLASGGADSAILVADQAEQGHIVHPLYIRFGLAWESVEELHLRRFLESISDHPGVRPLTVLELPVGDRHCQACNKCAERRKGFAEAGIEDRTLYAPR